MRVRRENSVVLRAYLAPARTDLRRRAGPVRQDSPPFWIAPHLFARESHTRLRPLRGRRNEERGARALGASVRIARDVYPERAAARAVALVRRRLEYGTARAWLRAQHAKRPVAVEFRDAQAEVDVGHHFDELPLGDNDLARSVARELEMDKRDFGLSARALRGVGCRSVDYSALFPSEAKNLARP